MGIRSLLPGLVLAAVLLAGPVPAGPRQITFSYAPDALAPDEWRAVRELLYREFAAEAAEAAEVRRRGDDMLDERQTTVAHADIDFYGIDELFVLLYGPDVVCFPTRGCALAMLERTEPTQPWRLAGVPTYVFSVGPPLLYMREDIAGEGRRVLFSTPDKLVAEPGPDLRVPFQRGADALAEAEWVALRDELNAVLDGRVRTRADLDVARIDAEVTTNPLELLVVVRAGCGGAVRCPIYAFSDRDGALRGTRMHDLDTVFIDAKNDPVLLLREDTKLG
jgi:hypothetical protein